MSKELNKKRELVKKAIIWTFTGIPLLSSLISTVHLVDLFLLGNVSWMSYVLAIAFELGSIASLLILTILDRVNKSMVMSIFIVLMAFQILGNVYFSFDYINIQLLTDPNWLGSFQELISYIASGDQVLMKLLVSLLVGVPIPLISLFFLKSLVDYLKVDNEPEKDTKVIPETEFKNPPIGDTKVIPETEFKNPPVSKMDLVDTIKPKFDENVEFNREVDITPNFQKDPVVDKNYINKEQEELEKEIYNKEQEELEKEIYNKGIEESKVPIFQNNNIK